MTHRHQDLETVRKACIAANPEIMELKFGAKVKLLDYEQFPDAWGIYAGKQFWKLADGYRDLVMHPDGNLYPMDRKYEVVGRPVTLPDVLLAMGRVELIGAQHTFEGFLHIGHHTKGRYVTAWNLRATLDDQSDETLAFLAGLLSLSI